MGASVMAGWTVSRRLRRRELPQPHLARFGAFPAAVLVGGTAWSVFSVFGLGNWDPKFGPERTAGLAILLVGCLAALAIPVNALVVLLLGRLTSGWTSRRWVVVSAAAAAITIALLWSGAIEHLARWVADRIGIDVGTLFGASGLAGFVAVCGLVQANVLAACIFAAGLGRTRNRET